MMQNINFKKWSIAIIIYLCVTVLTISYISQIFDVSHGTVILFAAFVFFPMFAFFFGIYRLIVNGNLIKDEVS